jgi:hypothetical protein
MESLWGHVTFDDATSGENFDKNNLLHINGQTGGSPYRLCQICNTTLKIKQEPPYLKQFYKILKYKNVPKY